MSTATTVSIPAQRQAEIAARGNAGRVRHITPDDGHTAAGVEFFEEAFARIAEKNGIAACSADGEPVWEMDDHTLACGDCFASYRLEN